MNVSRLIKDIIKSLPTTNNLHSDAHAWWIAQAITQKTKAQLIAQDEITLTPKQQQTIKTWLDKLNHDTIPLAYLIDSVPFLDLEIFVEQPILIPRPETEEWCYNFIEQLKPLKQATLTILDMCTGTGCIALALAHALPKATIYAVDINPHALALAHKNAIHNTITNVHFLESNLFAAIQPAMQFDIIVANPPYIAKKEWLELDKSVKDWEDEQALIAPNNGTGILKAIINQAPTFLHQNHAMNRYTIPQLLVEIGHTQANEVYNLMQHAGFSTIVIKKDFVGNDRIVTGSIRNVATNIK